MSNMHQCIQLVTSNPYNKQDDIADGLHFDSESTNDKVKVDGGGCRREREAYKERPRREFAKKQVVSLTFMPQLAQNLYY